MSIYKNLKLKTILYLFLLCFILFIISCSSDNNSNWVFVNSNDISSNYYNSLSIKVDKQNYIIEVWIRTVYTTTGKDGLLKIWEHDEPIEKYKDLAYSVSLELYNYKEWKSSMKHLRHYSALGAMLSDYKVAPKWEDIIPDTVNELVLNKIVKDYKIKR